MPDDQSSGEIIIILPSNLIAESRLQDQIKRNTFIVRNLDVFDVV